MRIARGSLWKRPYNNENWEVYSKNSSIWKKWNVSDKANPQFDFGDQQKQEMKFHIFSWSVLPQDTCQDSNHQTNAPRIQGESSLRLRSLSLRSAQQVRGSWSIDQLILRTKGWDFHPAVPLQHTGLIAVQRPVKHLSTGQGSTAIPSLPTGHTLEEKEPCPYLALGGSLWSSPGTGWHRGRMSWQRPGRRGRPAARSSRGARAGRPRSATRVCPGTAPPAPAAPARVPRRLGCARTRGRVTGGECHRSVTTPSLPGEYPRPSADFPCRSKTPRLSPLLPALPGLTSQPQPCHLFISGLRRVLTQEDTVVSNICVSSDLKATNAVNSFQRVNVISPHLNHAQKWQRFYHCVRSRLKITFVSMQSDKVMHLY